MNNRINISGIGREVGMDRRTAGKYVKYLYDTGLLEDKGDRTLLKFLEKNVATLVPCPTLR